MMSGTGLPVDFNEDDFEDFNPHPYLGGYDIAHTYGSPLPPSPAICYPLSLSPPPVHDDVLPPATAPPVLPPPPVHTAPQPYQPPPYQPDLFRSWPSSIPHHFCRHTANGDQQVRDFDYWNHMMRGLDFLFGHAQGYGERTLGTDVYGVPIYANKATPTPSLPLQLQEAPPVHTLQFHDQSLLDLHLHPHGLEVDTPTPTRPSWCPDSSNQQHNQNYGNSYQSDGYYNYQLQSTSNWDDVHSSYHHLGYSSDVQGHSTPVYSYNKHYHQHPLHVKLQPTDQTWTQKMISYESTNSSCYEEEEEEEAHQLNILSHSYERERYEQTQYEHLEPFKPSWSQNVGYYGEYLEGETVRSEDYSTVDCGEGNGSSAFAYNEENMCYEQNQSSWASRDGHVLYGEDVSYKPSLDDEPRNWTDAIFGSSHNYYAYDH